MKEITLIKIFGSLLILTAIVGAIVHTWALWPQARQEWEELLDSKPKTMLFTNQAQSHEMKTKFNVGDLVRYTPRPGAELEHGYVKQIRLDQDGLKVWVVYVRKDDINTNWMDKTGQLTPTDKLEKID